MPKLAVVHARLKRDQDSQRERNIVIKLNEKARKKGAQK